MEMRWSACRLSLKAAVLLGIGIMAAATSPAADLRPFQAGERLIFELRWTIIPAGEATLEVHPDAKINDQPARHFVLTARTNSFVDAFYKVRDRIDAYTDPTVSRTLHYKKKQREGRTKRDVEVRFDWDKAQAVYSDQNNTHPPLDLMPGSLDVLSAFYFTRLAALQPDTTIERPITDGKKNVIGRARVIRRETIAVPAGTFDTFLIEPELRHVRGVFEKSPNAKIQVWITADHRRLPVRVRSRVVVGSFIGELITAEGLTPEPVNATAVGGPLSVASGQ